MSRKSQSLATLVTSVHSRFQSRQCPLVSLVAGTSCHSDVSLIQAGLVIRVSFGLFVIQFWLLQWQFVLVRQRLAGWHYETPSAL